MAQIHRLFRTRNSNSKTGERTQLESGHFQKGMRAAHTKQRIPQASGRLAQANNSLTSPGFMKSVAEANSM